MASKPAQSHDSEYINDISVDCVMIGFHGDDLKVLLLKSTELGWSLPRGRMLKSERIVEAASRVLKETTGIQDVFLQQFHTFNTENPSLNYSAEKKNRLSKVNRSAAHFRESIISIGFYALVDFEKISPILTDSFQWCRISEIPDLRFAHNDMIELALVALRKDLRYLPIAKLLPQKFTLREMQKLYETILNRTFDRRNFHKLLMSYDFLVKLPEKKVGTANKSPHLYQIDLEKYETALQDGISY